MRQANDDLSRGLRALAEADGPGAPAWMEGKLRDGFRRRTRSRRIAVVTAIAAGLVGLVALIPRGEDLVLPPLPVARVVIPVFAQEAAQQATTPEPRVRRAASRRPTRELALTAFYPLPGAAESMDFGAVVRVQRPRSALRMVGLPVNEERLMERIQADVVLGQDGTARAVRFIQ